MLGIIKNKKKKKEENIDKKEKKKRSFVWLFLLLFIIPMAAYFWFGLYHLDEFETADEHLWISNLYTGRVQQYWNALADNELEKTRINDKPGITVALFSGFGMNYESDVKLKVVRKENLWIKYNPDKMIETFRIYRFPTVMTTGFMVFFIFMLIYALTKQVWLALSGGSFIALSPILIGISQIVNPDAFLWMFSIAAVLSFALFLKKSSFAGWFFSALFLALALLSKYVALIFIPFFAVMAILYLYWFYPELEEKKSFRIKSIVVSLGLVSSIILGIVGFSFGMPAVLEDKKHLLAILRRFGEMEMILRYCAYMAIFIFADALIFKSFILRKVFKYTQFLKMFLPRIFYLAMTAFFVSIILNWSIFENFIGTPFMEDYGGKRGGILMLPFHVQAVSQGRALVFALTPIVIFFAIFSWVKAFFKKTEFEYLTLILSAFIPIFLFAVTKEGLLLQVRYSIVLFPFILVLAGIGFYEMTRSLKNWMVAPLFAVILMISAYHVLQIRPYYFNYTNDLMPKKYIISDGWGYGGYEAVQYIKSQGDDKEMKIWTDYYGVCPFFAGKCVQEGSVKWMKDKEIMNIDYVVLSTKGYSKNKSGRKEIGEIFPIEKLVWELNIGGREANFVRVYKNELKGTVAIPTDTQTQKP